VLASNGLNAQDLADSVAVGRVAESTEHSIQNSKNSLNLARSWWDEGWRGVWDDFRNWLLTAA